MKCKALCALMSQEGYVFFLQLIAAYCKCWPWNPNSLDPEGLGPFSPFAHQYQPFPSKPGHRPCSKQDGEGFLCPPEPPGCLLLLSGLPAWHNKDTVYLYNKDTSEDSYLLELQFQDRLLLKREEIRFEAALSNCNAHISFLNILSDLDCSAQGGNKKYSFCNPALL